MFFPTGYCFTVKVSEQDDSQRGERKSACVFSTISLRTDILASSWFLLLRCLSYRKVRDNLVALKIVRDGLSLVWFNRLKKRYRLKNWEQSEVMQSIRAFEDFLRTKGFVRFDASVNTANVNWFALRYGLEMPDATHLCLAKETARYLLTIDPDLLETKAKIKTLDIIRPATLETLSALRRRT